MSLTSKDIEILKYFVNQDKILSVKDIGGFFNMGERAVRYRVNKIQNFLTQSTSVGQIEIIKRKGFYLTNRGSVLKWIEKFELKIDLENYQYSLEEVMSFIILKLSISAKDVMISEMKRILGLSEPTIKAHIKELNPSVMKRGLALIYQKRKGYRIIGNRPEIEKYFLEVLLAQVDLVEIIHFIKTVGETQTKVGELLLSNIFELDDIEKANAEVEKFEEQTGRSLNDREFVIWIIHEAFNEQLNHSEMNLTSDLQENKIDSLNFPNWDDFVKQLIDEVESKLSIDLHKNATFKKVLREHLKGLVLRLQSHEIFQNPIYDSFIAEYGEFTAFLENVITEICHRENIVINEQEVSLIAILFLSEIQKSQKRQSLPSVLIICKEGRLVSNIVANKISTLFESRKLDVISVHKFSPELFEKYDIVITTVELSGELKKKTIFITPLFTKEDLKKLLGHLPLRLSTNHQSLKKFGEIMELIEENAMIKNYTKLEFMLLKLLNSKENFNERQSPDINFSLASIAVISENIGWEKGIDIACQHLILEGCIEPRYQEKIKSNTREFGSYMNVSPGIFIAHAGINDGCLKAGVAVTKFEKGLKIVSDQKVPIDYVITIAFSDTKVNRILERTVNFISDEEKMKQLRTLKTREEIYYFLRINYLKA